MVKGTIWKLSKEKKEFKVFFIKIWMLFIWNKIQIVLCTMLLKIIL